MVKCRVSVGPTSRLAWALIFSGTGVLPKVYGRMPFVFNGVGVGPEQI